MPRQAILLVDTQEATFAFLKEYFGETQSELFRATSSQLAEELLKSKIPSLIFVRCSFLTARFRKSLLAHQQERGAKVFSLGEGSRYEFSFEGTFPTPIDPKLFPKRLLHYLQANQPAKVLVVDDEVEVCLGLKNFLEGRRQPSFEVDYALDGREGIRKVEASNPDCVLLDLKMPVMNGPEFYREIRRRFPRIRTIIVSALVGTEEVQAVRRWGSPVILEKATLASGYLDLALEIEKQLFFS